MAARSVARSVPRRTVEAPPDGGAGQVAAGNIKVRLLNWAAVRLPGQGLRTKGDATGAKCPLAKRVVYTQHAACPSIRIFRGQAVGAV